VRRELMTTRLEGWVRCLLHLRPRWADLRPVDGGLVGRRCGWIFIASTTLFFLFFFVTVAAGEVGVMCEAWLAGEVRGGEKLSILFMIFSICLLASSLYARNSDRNFSHLAGSYSFRKNREDMVMVWIGDCCRKQSTFALIPLDALK
jgi:heme/copper-type cytochrome/quinol oxidase subunit 3